MEVRVKYHETPLIQEETRLLNTLASEFHKLVILVVSHLGDDLIDSLDNLCLLLVLSLVLDLGLGLGELLSIQD